MPSGYGPWFAAHVGTIAVLLIAASLTLLALMAAYNVALAWAKLRAWWHGGSWLGHRGGRGGYSAEYESVLHSPRWRRLRRSVLRRQGGRCAVPGCTARARDVHHAEGYRNLGKETPGELLAVCERHHRQLHRR